MLYSRRRNNNNHMVITLIYYPDWVSTQSISWQGYVKSLLFHCWQLLALNHIYMSHIYAKGLLGSNFIRADIQKILNFHEIA